MQTKPFERPEAGMILFIKSLKLAAEITSVTPTGFRLHVLNGLWPGEVKDDKVVVHYPMGPLVYDRDGEFAEVVSVSKEEFNLWHMHNAQPKARMLLDAGSPHQDMSAGALNEINNLIEAQGWSEKSVTDLSRDFIREAGMAPQFLEYLEAQAKLENSYSMEDEDLDEGEPGF